MTDSTELIAAGPPREGALYRALLSLVALIGGLLGLGGLYFVPIPAGNREPLLLALGLVLGWGSTYGSITSAVERLRAEGHSVSSAHLRHLNPFPSNLGDVLRSFERVIIPEMNLGQLCTMIRAKYLVDAVPFSKVKGRPFQIREIVKKVEEYL